MNETIIPAAAQTLTEKLKEYRAHLVTITGDEKQAAKFAEAARKAGVCRHRYRTAERSQNETPENVDLLIGLVTRMVQENPIITELSVGHLQSKIGGRATRIAVMDMTYGSEEINAMSHILRGFEQWQNKQNASAAPAPAQVRPSGPAQQRAAP